MEAVCNVAKGMEQIGDHAGAKQVTQMAQKIGVQFPDLIVEALAHTEQMAVATNMTDSITDGQQRSQALRIIVGVQADSHNFADALRTVKRISDGDCKDDAFTMVADAYVEAGDIDGAVRLLLQMHSNAVFVQSSIALARASALVRAGKLDDARAIAEHSSEDDKADVYSAIAIAQAKAGDVDGAKQTIDGINDLRPEMKAATLCHMVEAIMESKK